MKYFFKRNKEALSPIFRSRRSYFLVWFFSCGYITFLSLSTVFDHPQNGIEREELYRLQAAQYSPTYSKDETCGSEEGQKVCLLPDLEPVKTFNFFDRKLAPCAAEADAAISTLDTHTHILTMQCPYWMRAEWRGDAEGGTLEELYTFNPEWNTYTAPVYIPHIALIETRCSSLFHLIEYRKFHVQNTYNNNAAQRASTILQQQSNVKKPINVMMLMFDMVSSAHFQRALPQTVHTLRQFNATLNNRFQVFEFEGYNVVGEDSWANQNPMLHGKQEAASPPPHPFGWNGPLDNWTWIWDYYKEKGYITSFSGDDCVSLWYWHSPPTDHFILKKLFCAAKLNAYSSQSHCVHDTFAHQLQFDYLHQFWNNYKDIGHFAFAAFSEGHEDTGTVLTTVDKDLSNFLQSLAAEGSLDDTLLMILSDHGPRYGWYRRTLIGEIEHKLPVLQMLVPNALLQYPHIRHNLLTNRRRLVTPYDIYATLKHLPVLPAAIEPSLIPNHSKSLFDEIPCSRTCEEVGIPTAFCSCLPWHQHSVDKTMVKVAEYFVKHMNSHITEPYRDKCHLLQLHNVLGVWQQAAASNTSCAHHQIEFQTVPGDAIWRATTCLYENTTRATFPILSIKRVTSFERDKVCGLPKPENEYCVCRQATPTRRGMF